MVPVKRLLRLETMYSMVLSSISTKTATQNRNVITTLIDWMENLQIIRKMDLKLKLYSTGEEKNTAFTVGLKTEYSSMKITMKTTS